MLHDIEVYPGIFYKPITPTACSVIGEDMKAEGSTPSGKSGKVRMIQKCRQFSLTRIDSFSAQNVKRDRGT
jgi:hypothetical protein